MLHCRLETVWLQHLDPYYNVLQKLKEHFKSWYFLHVEVCRCCDQFNYFTSFGVAEHIEDPNVLPVKAFVLILKSV